MHLLYHIPTFIILVLYLPAALLGSYLYQNKFSTVIIFLLIILVSLYYILFPLFSKFLQKFDQQAEFTRIRARLNWRVLAWLAVIIYGITMLVAVFTVEHTPLGAALLGGSELDIARARAEFLATRQGPEALLRYLALIFGKTVMPFIVLCLFYRASRWKYLALCVLLCSYMITLEKSAAIFAFLPILLFFIIYKRWRSFFIHILTLTLCIVIWTFLATGGLDKNIKNFYKKPIPTSSQLVKSDWPIFISGGSVADGYRIYFIRNLIENNIAINCIGNCAKSLAMLNRIAWIPYITAYDWLRFHDQILDGKMTYGQQIGIVSWLRGVPKLQLEQMVYDFQLGQPQAGAGSANTIFLVDAKLAFGWGGVIAYCVLFAFFSAIIFSSANEVVKISSITSFYTAALSPLTATLLSGGLMFYILMAFFHRNESA